VHGKLLSWRSPAIGGCESNAPSTLNINAIIHVGLRTHMTYKGKLQGHGCSD